ncbi:NmrA family NAD(P)-binding protein [Pinirhizobacter soli]|uniref:NmrA family NAD(P)-binding protein n=1 Tax=Pinirhizobacter soli TaxID=2786953 RepID=UPI00202AA4F0|nr:NmrA family NAD(P)-binding protein [Pinirhizobacter soli]
MDIVILMIFSSPRTHRNLLPTLLRKAFPMYAITGITGQVGSALANQLLNRGAAVRAVVRNAAKAQPWAARGCELAVADIADTDALAKAFSGTEGVFVLIPPNFDPSPGFPDLYPVIASLVRAIDIARPPKVVLLSTIGAQAQESNLLSQLGVVEHAFRHLPVPVAFLRAAWFMENAAWDVASARDQGMLHSFLQPLDKPVPMVATRDIAQVAAELLHDTWDGVRIVELEGPRRVSPNDLAQAFASATGREVKPAVVPRDTWEATFAEQGMRYPTPRARMIDGFNEEWIAFEGTATQVRKGPTSVQAVIDVLVAGPAHA